MYVKPQTDVEEYLGGADADVEGTLKSFQDALAYVLFLCIFFFFYSDIHLMGKRSKYRYMDSSLTQRRANLEEKIPDIRKTLDMVEYLRERRVKSFYVHLLIALRCIKRLSS